MFFADMIEVVQVNVRSRHLRHKADEARKNLARSIWTSTLTRSEDLDRKKLISQPI